MYMPRAIIGKQTRWASSRVRRRRVFCVCPERTYIYYIIFRIVYFVLFAVSPAHGLYRQVSLHPQPPESRSPQDQIYLSLLSRQRRTTQSLIKFDRFIFLLTSACMCLCLSVCTCTHTMCI